MLPVVSVITACPGGGWAQGWRGRKGGVGGGGGGGKEGRLGAGESTTSHAAEDGCRVMVIGRRRLDETPPVDIAHKRLAVGAKDVEPVHHLSKGQSDAPGKLLLFSSQQHGVAYLLATSVSQHTPIQGGRLSRLSVSVLGADRVDLQIRAFRRQILLIDVGAICAYHRLVWVEGGRLVLLLPEEPLGAPTHRVRVVDGNVVILGANRLLHKRFADFQAAQLQMVLVDEQLPFRGRIGVVEHHVLGHRHADGDQLAVDGPPVKQ
mmetsp:Transcript_10902/g.36129  ORF Transcript_10902/g.36129 Transcript_10902/m.36129 type:complete len:263 (+) Transcript_10902:880-1668(+)